MKTVLIEKTSKTIKITELIVLAVLFGSIARDRNKTIRLRKCYGGQAGGAMRSCLRPPPVPTGSNK